MRLNDRRGSMLLMTFYVIVSLVAVSAAFVMMMVNDRMSMVRQIKSQQANALAQAGLEKTIYELRKDFRSDQNWFDGSINGASVTQSSDDYYEFIPVTSESGGSFTVSLKNIVSKTDFIWIKSRGMVGDAMSTIVAYVTAVNPSNWTVQVVMWQKI